MIISPKLNPVIRDLGIVPTSVRLVGDAFIGLSSNNIGYAWRQGEIFDFAAGVSISMPHVNANEIERISDMHFAGVNPTGKSVFMSSSSAVHLEIGSPQPERHVSSTLEMQNAVTDFAVALSNSGKAMQIASESAGPRVYATYQGKKVHFDDASDEYDLELEKGDKYSLVYLNRDRYELRLKDEPKIVFTLRGHLRVANIIGQSVFDKEFGSVAADKVNTFSPVGVVGRNMATPIQLKKDTVIYMFRKKHYLPQNLAVPLEKVLDAADLSKLLNALKPVVANKAITKGKLVGVKLPPLAGGKKVKSEQPIKKDSRVVYGAFFPVSPAQPNRSRIVFGETIKDAQKKALEAVSRMAIPQDYFLFSTFSTDELYDLSKNGSVIIRASGLLQAKYAKAKKISMGYSSGAVEYTEPQKENPPEIRTPIISTNNAEIAREVYRLLAEGYFNTGLHLSINQPTGAISFDGLMDPAARGQVEGVARRIMNYLRNNGGELTKGSIRLAFGRTRAEIRFNLPKLSAAQLPAVDKLLADEPMLNAPIYATIKPKQPTVEIIAFNRHTGYVTVRAQRSSELYSDPYDTLYTNVERKNF
ncbi:hypothetical protein HOS33_gp116 [Erwinia phage vB_EamM_Y3]|uniref:KTSC and Metallopeptidase-like N-terminal fusion domain-containing protein n=1 Tax=Erwinia phage vB_EamM_Y3 TaxID=1983553 RepID=A0A2H4IB29_9CAUD|nr:hypothetical protein HOS33_gp116 [Erwinia phage vB_EamM_Y3]ARW58756.1 hypothetical protein Y3_116 [Erwinia phage vB_EamM_Y3]